MVAPVNLVYNYPTYRNPLVSTYTGKAIQLAIPEDFGQTAGFHLGTTAVPTATDEKYRLVQVSLRKPPQAYTGLGQALSHVLEMVLVHKQSNGANWANIILPFQVSTNGADMDIINPIVDGATLPTSTGMSGYVMTSAVSEMKLSPAFDNTNFSEFWGTAPVSGCTTESVNVRYFMRSNTLAIGVDTFAQMSNALENTPSQEPTEPPASNWIVGTCTNGTGTCQVAAAADLKTQLDNLKQAESQAITEQRTRKADLDTKLAAVQNHTGKATNASIEQYNAAVAAYDDLQAAASELVSAESHVAEVQTFYDDQQKYKWDQNAPASSTNASLAQKKTQDYQVSTS